MGRILKRVPLDFSWPLKRVWKGYINPYRGVDCPYCYEPEWHTAGGYTPEAQEYKKRWRTPDNAHYVQNPYRPNTRYCPEAHEYNLEQWEYDFIVNDEQCRHHVFGNLDPVPALSELKEYFLQQIDPIGSIVEFCLTEEYCRRKGVSAICPHCVGTGVVYLNDEIKKLHDEFKKVEPPTGDGYQLWETTSEGSPVSPVFETFDELCEWCVSNASTFADWKATKEEWAEMLLDGHVYHKEGNAFFM